MSINGAHSRPRTHLELVNEVLVLNQIGCLVYELITKFGSWGSAMGTLNEAAPGLSESEAPKVANRQIKY